MTTETCLQPKCRWARQLYLLYNTVCIPLADTRAALLSDSGRQGSRHSKQLTEYIKSSHAYMTFVTEAQLIDLLSLRLQSSPLRGKMDTAMVPPKNRDDGCRIRLGCAWSSDALRSFLC